MKKVSRFAAVAVLFMFLFSSVSQAGLWQMWQDYRQGCRQDEQDRKDREELLGLKIRITDNIVQATPNFRAAESWYKMACVEGMYIRDNERVPYLYVGKKPQADQAFQIGIAYLDVARKLYGRASEIASRLKGSVFAGEYAYFGEVERLVKTCQTYRGCLGE
jgi:hypothetical protein